ncbi:hypothetical protein PMALA_029060 [Plasmodium malariae]|uniref:Uncharacterized protein n=1 Tax=Plasmodium malariae TaxID=5858 RepID=A0A1A8WB44_PLAMA|nr:hypothetical protein PMALA_029060 [Plasmodium malariae]
MGKEHEERREKKNERKSKNEEARTKKRERRSENEEVRTKKRERRNENEETRWTKKEKNINYSNKFNPPGRNVLINIYYAFLGLT